MNSVVMVYGTKVGVRKMPLLRQGHFLTKWFPSVEINKHMYCISDVDSISGLVEADTRRAAYELGKATLQALPFWDAVRRMSAELDLDISEVS